MSALVLPRHLRRGGKFASRPAGFATYGTAAGGVAAGGRWPLDVGGLKRFFADDQVLAQWQLYPPWIVTHATAVLSPNTFNAGDWGTLTGVTVPGANAIRETATTDLHSLGQTLSNAIGPVVSASCEFEADGRDIVGLQLKGTALDAHATFLLGAGTVGTVANQCTSAITPLGGGVFRGTIYPTAIADVGNVSFRVLCRNADNWSTYLGDVTKGIKVYNATINQTSIVTGLNVYGDEMFALYGDRFDVTNPTKASEPVYGATAWNGRPAAVFSGANFMTANALAARYNGDDLPLWMLLAVQDDGVVSNQYFWSLGNSVDNAQYQATLASGAGVFWAGVKRVGGSVVQNTSVTPIGGARSILAHHHTGMAESIWASGAPTSVANSASNTTAIAVNQFTLGGLYRSAFGSGITATMREAAAGMSATDPQMLAASHYLMGRNLI